MEKTAEERPPAVLRREYQAAMDRCAALVRKPGEIKEQIQTVREQLWNFGRFTAVQTHAQLLAAMVNRDILLAQLTYLGAMGFYAACGGGSRGSYLMEAWDGQAPDGAPPGPDVVEESFLDPETLETRHVFRPVRPIPEDNAWFETIYNDYRMGRIFD